MGVSGRDCLPRPELERLQFSRLRQMLDTVLPRNAFHARRFDEAGVELRELRSLADLPRLPLLTKQHLLADQHDHPPYGSALTYSLDHYCRLHQTSGTSGQPLRWLDTPHSWSWALDNWEQMFAIAGVRSGDRLFFPFSFGPFLGFWTA